MGDIKTEMTREAAAMLVALPTGLAEVETALGTLAALQIDDATMLSNNFGEVVEESGLLAELLNLTAAAAEMADSSFSTGGTWLMSERRRIAGLLTSSVDDEFGGTGSPDEVRAHFELKAFEAAGIDPNGWDPNAGLDANAHIVGAVYEYYGGLYESDPQSYWWAGMAALIGPSFFGGFQDLETFADLMGGVGTIADLSEQVPGFPGVPGVPDGTDIASLGANALEAELRWYQTGLLSMQKEIFLDMATAHEAYRCGGMEAIEALFGEDPYGFGPETVEAWNQIDQGRETDDSGLIAQGNGTLLFREQRYIIDDDYQEMYERPITGQVVTYAMTAVGAPSVPGALSYPEVFPLDVDVSQYVGTPRQVTVIPGWWQQDVPHVGAEGTVTVTTPLPDGNIAVFDDRWNLIVDDTLPTYLDLAENHPDVIQEQLDIPVGDRADDYEIINRVDELASWAVNGWDVDVDVAIEAGW